MNTKTKKPANLKQALWLEEGVSPEDVLFPEGWGLTISEAGSATLITSPKHLPTSLCNYLPRPEEICDLFKTAKKRLNQLYFSNGPEERKRRYPVFCVKDVFVPVAVSLAQPKYRDVFAKAGVRVEWYLLPTHHSEYVDVGTCIYDRSLPIKAIHEQHHAFVAEMVGYIFSTSAALTGFGESILAAEGIRSTSNPLDRAGDIQTLVTRGAKNSDLIGKNIFHIGVIAKALLVVSLKQLRAIAQLPLNSADPHVFTTEHVELIGHRKATELAMAVRANELFEAWAWFDSLFNACGYLQEVEYGREAKKAAERLERSLTPKPARPKKIKKVFIKPVKKQEIKEKPAKKKKG